MINNGWSLEYILYTVNKAQFVNSKVKISNKYSLIFPQVDILLNKKYIKMFLELSLFSQYYNTCSKTLMSWKYLDEIVESHRAVCAHTTGHWSYGCGCHFDGHI